MGPCERIYWEWFEAGNGEMHSDRLSVSDAALKGRPGLMQNETAVAILANACCLIVS